MNNKDLLQRFILEDAAIRGEIVHLSSSYRTITSQHDYPKIVQKLLGEALVVVSLLAATIKFEGRLTMQFQGKGPLKLLFVQSDHNFHLRGLAQFDENLTESEMLESLSKGTLTITIDPEKGGKRYQGIVSWRGTTLAESIEGYFRDSEQLTTRLWLAVESDRAAGMLLQMLPGKETSPLKDGSDWGHVVLLTDTLSQDELLNLDNVTLLHRLYSEEDVRIFDSQAIIFQCTCSQTRSENALLLLGQEEVEEELQDKQRIVVTCQFCNKEFSFDRVDIAKLFNKGNQPPSSTQIH